MDRGQKRVLSFAASLLLLGAAARPLPITDARWVTPAARLEVLTTQPAECLAWPRDDKARRSVAIGRVAFRAPLLLGGQGARAGLSCASCHRNGRGNPHFSFPGLSGAPGTADVTSSLISSHRGDRMTNPKPIPDLATDAPKVPHDRQSRALESFIRGLIVEEFDGAEPPPPVLAGLADYVRAMRRGVCRERAEPISLNGELSEVDDALRLARTADTITMRLLVGAARSGLGRIDQRFALPGLEPNRRLLRSADAELSAIQRLSLAAAPQAIDRWRRRWSPRLNALRADEARSLFNPAILRRHLRRA